MQMIPIHTGLDSFILIDGILQAEARLIRGIKTFKNAPVYLGLESLAQLGAFHVRYLTDFQKHAFLLKINHCLISAQMELNGTYELTGILDSRSESAFSYGLRAIKNGTVALEGECLFATVDYDRHFKQEILQGHYQNVFSCLQNDIKRE